MMLSSQPAGRVNRPPEKEARYLAIQKMVAAYLGVDLTQSSDQEFQQLIHRIARRLELPEKDAIQQLLCGPGSSAWDALIQACTVDESYFFRHPAQFVFFEKELLPWIVNTWSHRRLPATVWSAGCSRGEEAYSLAMICAHHYGTGLVRWPLRIVGTDINRAALKQARQGVYSRWSLRNHQNPLTKTFLNRSDSGHLRVDERIRKFVEFRPLNLVTDDFSKAGFLPASVPVIFCRNVLMYMHPKVRRQVLQKFYQVLQPGGWFILSPTETFFPEGMGFQIIRKHGVTAFRKPPGTKRVSEWSSNGTQSAEFSGLFPERHDLRAIADQSTRPSFSGKAKLQRSSFVGGLEPNRVIAPAPEGEPRAGQPLRTGQAVSANRSKRPEGVKQSQCPVAQIQRLASCRNYQAALQLCNQVLEGDPVNPKVLFLKAMIYQEQNDLKTAAELFRQVVFLDPEFLLAGFHLARLWHQLGKTRLADRQMKQLEHQLAGLPADHPLPMGEGMKVRELRQVLMQMQQNGR